MHIQKAYKEGKWKEGDVCKAVNVPNNFLTDAQAHLLFLNVVLC